MKSIGELVLYFVVGVFIVALISEHWHSIALFLEIAISLTLISIVAIWLHVLIRRLRANRYFASEDFQSHKRSIAALVAEHNDIAGYAQSIRNTEAFHVGSSLSGVHASLASSQNTSHHNYRRDRNAPNFQSTNVHNCSLQVVRNAARDPIKYLIKYFHIKPTEDSLGMVEELGERISRLESAIKNLRSRESSITTRIDPPGFVLKHFRGEFMQHAGVNLARIDVPYPTYIFEYVSAGGNSSQRTTVTLNAETIDATIEVLSQRIKFRKSAAGQRALMTAKLREQIKDRDKYTCGYCGVSLADEPHLLLEVDHIFPVSKGGLTTEENLQTLCWRCNRSKSNKIQSGEAYA